jgi:predicted MFS family arabinose efflux permease
VSNAFRALRTRNYRLYFSGQLVSLIGTWMQIIGQSWLVLKLTGSGLDVGIVNALQFGPMLLAGVWGGLIADRYPKRRTLIVTQASFAVLAAVLALLVTGGWVQLWMVYALAFLYGSVQVVDMPTRQAFVPEMVSTGDVMNAVSLNTAVFNGARLIGPAIAGIVIAKASIGVCFWVNSASFVAVIIALLLMRDRDLFSAGARPAPGPGQIRAGLRYVRSEPDLLFPLILMAVVGTLGFNFQIILPLLAKFTFHGNAQTYGTMSSVIAIGSLGGAMFAATRTRPTKQLLIGSSIAFGFMELVTAFMPSLGAAYLALPLVGLATIIFISTANSTLQLTTSPEMRGRVLALFSLVFLGSTPIGGPLVGWISEKWSPRAALGVGGVGSIAAGVVIGAILLTRRRRELREDATGEPIPVEKSMVAAAGS